MFFRSRKIQKPLPDSVEECLALSVTAADPRDRRKYVEHALEIDGDDLKANRALLMLGRLGEGGRIDADLSRIKSYLLTIFVKPDSFTPEQRRAMAREIYDHPQLKKCLDLCADREKFLRAYIRDLSGEYAQLFIDSAGEFSGSLLGFSTPQSRVNARVAPFTKALTNILDCPDLAREERLLLLEAMRDNAKMILGSDGMARLYKELPPRVLSALEAEGT